MFRFEDFIRDIRDFPKPGVIYKDISLLLLDPGATKEALRALLNLLEGKKIDKVVGIESRGFFFATLLAQELQAGFVPIRKPGKLPYKTHAERYSLEYGEDSVEVHQDAICEGEKILVHDDVLATGGTAAAACKLVEKLGGEIVQCNFLMDIKFLNGRQRLGSYDVVSLATY